MARKMESAGNMFFGEEKWRPWSYTPKGPWWSGGGEGCRTKMKTLCTPPKADLGSPGKGFLAGEAAAISACQGPI